MTHSTSFRNKVRKITAVLLALLFWQVLSFYINESMIMAGPLRVLERLGELLRSAAFYRILLYSTLRTGLGFVAAVFLALILAFAAYRYAWLRDILAPYILAMKSIPVASFVILALILAGSRYLALFISFVMAFPLLYTSVLTGLRATPEQMLDMAKVYRIRGLRRLRYIYFPVLLPHLLSAFTAASGMAWKASVAAEMIGLTKYSIGEALYEAKIYFATEDLFAWTLVIILLSLCFEKICIFLLKGVYRYACG